ncbi:MAG: phosphoglycerate mutase [Actinomycetota bacterium]|nr:phosphoglycerate mutase [Actinomycetota bacterium]
MSPRPAGYGESAPRLDDDRLPVVLVVLDGLGDRPLAELGGRTPAEAAYTPHLDALAGRGSSGWHLPFGWGRAASSELSHWSMLGYERQPFPGRAVLEALGAGLDVTCGVPATHAALRTSERGGVAVRITGRAAPGDAEDCAALLGDLGARARREGWQLVPYPSAPGEALLLLDGLSSGDITDSDPFFEELHPWLRPRALRPAADPGAAAAAERSATALTAFLQDCHALLVRHPVNIARTERGVPALDVLTTKWTGVRQALPSFAELVGVPGAAVTSSRLYRGLAAALGLSTREPGPRADFEADLRTRLQAADDLLSAGAAFVHVHTKAPDEAGHSKEPYAKRDVLEAVDRGLAALGDLADRAVVAVTGDHATPSRDGLLHSGDPTLLVVAGPTVRPDEVECFGEEPARRGAYGILAARDLLPLLLGSANRPAFLGHRPTPWPALALPDAVEAMPVGPVHPEEEP